MVFIPQMKFLMECCVLNTKLKMELDFSSFLNICAGRTGFMESLDNITVILRSNSEEDRE